MHKLMKFAAVAAATVALLGSAAFAYAQTATPTPATPSAAADTLGQRPPGGRPGRAGGTVIAVTADALTLETRDGQTVTVAISDTTTVRLVEGHATGSLSDIVVGAEVRVRGQRNAADSAAPAVEIMVEPSGDEASGQVTAVDGATLTLTDRTGATLTVTTTAATVYQGGPDQTTAPTAATVGQRVHAYGVAQADGSVTARLVLVNDRPAGGHGGHGGACPSGAAGDAPATDPATITPATPAPLN